MSTSLFEFLERLFHRSPRYPAFPKANDLPALAPEDAELALRVLRGMVLIDTASVYTAATSHGKRWNVWLAITRRRLTLHEWAEEWLQTHQQQQAALDLNPLNPVAQPYRLISRQDGIGYQYQPDEPPIGVTRLLVERVSDGTRFSPTLPTNTWRRAAANSTYDQHGHWLVADCWLWMFCAWPYLMTAATGAQRSATHQEGA